MSARYDNIEQLDELRKSGALSEEEYEKEKKLILNSKDEPQKTIIQTRERSSFGSIIFGGIVLFVILGGFYFLFMQGGAGDGEGANADANASAGTNTGAKAGAGNGAELSLPAEDEGGLFEEEVTVTSGNEE